MLKPFRIRNLYFNSSDLIDCSGVVQLSSQQYDQEIQLTPEAVFAYLDEEDGETVTVSVCNIDRFKESHEMSRWDRPLNSSNDSSSHQVNSQAGRISMQQMTFLRYMSSTYAGRPLLRGLGINT